MSFDLSSSFPHFKIPMADGSKNGIYEFDTYRLDVGKLMLYRRGDEISLPPKVIKTLAVLVENGNEILSKDDLIDRVWTDSIVEEASLSQHLYLLRKTLGNKSDGKPYIETLRRRGYRFTGDARPASEVPGTNGRKETLPEPLSPSIAVERQGNVLRLVDWNVSETAPGKRPSVREEAVLDEKSVPSHQRFVIPRVAIGAAILLVVGTAIVLFWYPARPVAPVTSPKELTIQRLTNGAFPLDATISPDGDYFVYHETDGETSRLWLQQVGQSGRVEIGNTSDRVYSAKTFSPDGRFIYYVAQEKGTNASVLYRVPAMGGPHSRLTTAAYGPVSFSPDGNELVFLRFDKDMMTSSLIIADKDGRQERVFYETAHPKRIVGPPSWSPDGKLIAFAESDMSNLTLSGTVTIQAITFPGGAVEILSAEKWDTVYRIVWTSDGKGFLTIATRAKEGMSPRRDQIYYISHPEGVSVRLTNEGNRHHVWALGVTKDDAVIAVPFSRSSQVWSVDVKDMSKAEQISTGIADGRAGLAPLPDGRVGYIARAGDELNIWIMNADGSGAKQIISDPPVVEEIRADPRGRYLVFAAEQDTRTHLFRIDTEGGNLRQLTFGDGNEGDSTIAPDGNWIVYGSVALKDGPFHSELWKVSIDGGEPMRFSKENCASPTFSPDGGLVSCIRDDKEILVLSATDGRIVESYRLPSLSTVNFGAGWTPDGSGLTFIRAERNFSNVWVQPRSGVPARKLTDFTSGHITRFAFATDGSRLFVARGYPLGDSILIRNFR